MVDDMTTDWGDFCDAWKLNPHGPARRPCGMPAVHDIGGVVYLCRFHYKNAYNDVYFNVVVEKNVHPVVDDQQFEPEETHQYEMFMAEQVVKRLTAKVDTLQYENSKMEDELAELKSTKLTNTYKPKKESPTQLVYFIRCEGFVKIGISSNPEKRLLDLQRSGNGTLAPPRIDLTTAEIVTTEPGGRAKESELHDMFAYLRIVGEWFAEEDEITEYIDNVRFNREQAA